MTEAQAAAYLAALVDGEGCVRTGSNRSVSVANTDWDIVSAAIECCVALGLRHRLTRPRLLPSGKHVWEVMITTRDALQTFRAICPIQSRRKIALLDEAIAAYHKPRYPVPPREWLEEKYVFEGLSMQVIAGLRGVPSGQTVQGWLRFYGIPARSRSEANTLRHAKARQ